MGCPFCRLKNEAVDSGGAKSQLILYRFIIDNDYYYVQ
jgi:hypothetical protein